MNKKRILLTVLAMVLVCVLSVAGTMALLTENTAAVTNTFVASVSDPEKFVDTFELKEYQVAADGKGSYTLTTTEVDNNTYNVVPGVTLPKDAFVKLSRENDTPAYLFVEVVNNLSNEFTMNVDTTKWGKLEVDGKAVTGKNGGDIYVLGTADAPTVLGAVTATDGVYHIIEGNKVAVASNAQLKITKDSNDTIKFYAYICQATVAKADGTNTSDPAEVFGICFPNT